MRFGRALGILGAGPLEADGVGSFTFHLAGTAWPWNRPSVTAQASVRSARLVVPGLSEPLNIPRARIQVYGKQVIINPVVAVMGTSVFSGWVMHQRGSHLPWDFKLKADKLSIEQASQWFEGIGDRNTPSFLDRIADIGALIGARRPSFHLTGRLDARGDFSTPRLTYRELSLLDFRARVSIHDRKLRLARVQFEAGGGRGEGNALVDLSKTPARVSGEAGIKGARVQALESYLPAELARVRGYYAASGTFEASGLTHSEITRTLSGTATVHLENISLGDFNPVRTLALGLGMDLFEESAQPLFIPRATANLHVQNRRVVLEKLPVEVDGAEFQLHGGYSFDGTANVQVRADLRGIHQPWAPISPRTTGAVSRVADLQFAGTLRKLAMVPSAQISQTQP